MKYKKLMPLVIKKNHSPFKLTYYLVHIRIHYLYFYLHLCYNRNIIINF
jgi:hypothetical protein